MARKRSATSAVGVIRKVEENRPSIIATQLETICRPFGALATEVFKGIPTPPAKMDPDPKKPKAINPRDDFENKVIDYLDRKWFAAGPLATCVQNVAIVAATTPEPSFKELIATLPQIELQATTEPEKPKGKITILTYLTGVDWSNFYVRAAFQFLVDSIICEFLNRLLLVSTTLNREAGTLILRKILDLWFPAESPPAFYTRVRLINGDLIGHSIHLLSQIAPEDLADQLLKKMPQPKDPDISIQLYCQFFQWVVLGDQSRLNYRTLPDSFKSLESIARKAKPSGSIHGPAMSYFLNLMGYLLQAYPDYRKQDFIFDLSEIAKEYTTEKGYAGAAYSLRALLYTFNDHKKMKLSVDEYIKKYIDKTLTEMVAPFHVESFLYFIRGFHYAAKCALDISEENLKWRSEDAKVLAHVLKQVIAHPAIYTKAQVPLGDLFLQIAASDFPGFVNTHLPQITAPAFAAKNQHALFHLAHRILSTHSRFGEYAKDGADSGARQRFSETFKGLVSSLLASLAGSVGSGKTIAYGAVPFVETLHLSQPRDLSEVEEDPDHDSKLELAMSRLKTTSPATVPVIPKPKVVLPKLKTKWVRFVNDDFADLLFASASKPPVEFAKLGKYLEDANIAAIGLIPYLEFSEDIVRNLTKLIFSPLAHVASISLRVLQSLIHVNADYLDSILHTLTGTSAPDSEYLYLQIQAVSHIIESGKFVAAKLSAEAQQGVFELILTGLTSSQHVIRAQSLTLVTDLQLLSRKREPDLQGFITSQLQEIDNEVQRVAISIGCYRIDPNFADMEPISLLTIAASEYDFLYSVVLATLGRFLKSSGITGAVDSARPGLIAALDNIGKSDPLHYTNIVALLAGYGGPEHSDWFVSNVANIRGKLAELGGNKIIPYAAIYTFVVPEIGVPLIDRLDASKPFDMHVITLATRYLMKNGAARNGSYCLEKSRLVINSFQQFQLFEPRITFKVNDTVLADLDNRSAMANLLLTLRLLFQHEFDQRAVRPHGPYARAKHVVQEHESSSEDTLLFAFLFNMTNLDDSKTYHWCRYLSGKVLDSFSKVYVIPSDLFNLMRESLEWIAKCSFSTLCVVLDNYYLDILPQYVANASKHPAFFSAIAAQFIECELARDFLTAWTECVDGTMSRSDQDFANTTFNVTGTLLALGFWKLASEDVKQRQDGFRVVFNISLSTIVLRDPHANIGGLLQKLFRLKSLVAAQHPELSENILVSISKIIHAHAVFCAEQFIDKAFRLCDVDPGGSVFVAVIAPWLRGLVFNRQEEPGVVVGAEPRFMNFSTFSFFSLFVEFAIHVPLNRSHVLMIDHVLDQPSADTKTPTLLTFVLALFRLQQRSEETAVKCIHVLTYCLTRQPKFIISHVATYLEFRSWFYHQVQLSRIDLAFDMDRFMAQITGAEEAGGGASRKRTVSKVDDEEDSIALYDVQVKFSLRVFLSFIKEAKTALIPVHPIIILFCLANFDGPFDKRPQELLKELCGEETGDAPLVLHSFSSALLSTHANVSSGAIQAMSDDITELANLCGAQAPIIASTVQFIMRMSEKRKRAMCDEALRWALTCGEIQVAARAAKIYEMFMTTSDEDKVKQLVRTIHIVSSIITERSAVDFKNASSFLSVIVEGTRVDFKIPVQYLTLLIKILTKSQQYLPKPSDEAYWLCCSCLQVSDHLQMPVACAALRYVIQCIRNKKFLKAIVTVHDSNFRGFLRPILKMEHNAESLELSYEVLTFLIVGHADMLTRNTAEGQLLLMAMLPYLHTHQYDPEIEVVVQSIIDLTSDRVIKEHLAKKAGSADDYVYPIMNRLVKAFSESQSLARIIGFYTNVAKAESSMLAPIFSICTAILQTPGLPITLDCFGEIGFTAIHDSDPSRNTIALTFLSSLNNRSGYIQPHNAAQRMKQLPKILLHTPMDVSAWDLPDGDPFDRIIDLPPLSIIDIDYLGCSFQQPISNLVQVIKVEPLSTWSRVMFRAETLAIQYEEEGNISPVSVSPDYTVLFKLFEDTLGAGEVAPNPAENDEDEEVIGLASVGKEAGKKRKQEKEKEKEEEIDDGDFQTNAAQDSSAVDGVEFVTVSSSEFLPPKQDVELIGADLVAQFKLAQLFPANLR